MRDSLSLFSRSVLCIGSHVGALLNPRRGDLVAAANESSPGLVRALTATRATMWKNTGNEDSAYDTGVNGRLILQQMPRLDGRILDQCRGMPVNSFGFKYYQFMKSRGIHPDERPPVRFVHQQQQQQQQQRYNSSNINDSEGNDASTSSSSNSSSSSSSWQEKAMVMDPMSEYYTLGSADRINRPSLASLPTQNKNHNNRVISCPEDVPLWYIMCRYREVHDLWHVLFDVPTDLIGMVCVQYIQSKNDDDDELHMSLYIMQLT